MTLATEALSGSLEDNVLTLLCHSVEHASTIALRVEDGLYSTRAYQRIAGLARDHLTRYGRPPGVHLRDLLETELRRGDEGRFLGQVLTAMEELATGIQVDYVLEQLDHFIRLRRMSQSVERAADLLHAGDLSEAEEALAAAHAPSESFSPGQWFHGEDWLSFNREDEDNQFTSGIEALDERGVVPARGEIFLAIAAAKKGKSWWLTQIGRDNALIHHRKVLHISLENSIGVVRHRYTQCFLSLTRGEAQTRRIPVYRKDSLGRFMKLDFHSASFDALTPERTAIIAEQLRPYQQRAQLLVQAFPSGVLTLAQLDNYLMVLDKEYDFRPEIVVLDYFNLMMVDGRDLRISLSRLLVGLRGLAARRNFALVTATQGNRSSSTARLVGSNHVAEDWSMIGTADTVVTYSQTLSEKEKGIARLLVAGGRNAEDNWKAMISQSYATGQFCLDSVYMNQLVEEELARHTDVEREQEVEQ